MRKGIVTHIDAVFGKGFIEDENGQDIFFDLDLASDNICKGDQVKFQIILGPEGLVATDVTVTAPEKHIGVTADGCATFAGR